MYSKNTLFWLIKSLSRGEKRAFKLFASKYNKGNENALIWLFEKINGQTEYNEEILLKKLNKLGTKSPLTVLKTKLFNAILQSLRGHASFQDYPISKINERNEFAHILFQRGLFKEASTFIDKALNLAEEMEYYNEVLSIIELKHKISRHYLSVEQYKLLIEELDKKRVEINEILNNEWVYTKLNQELNYIYRKYDAPQNEEERMVYQKFFDNPLLQNPKGTLSSQALIYFYVLKTFYHNLLGTNEDAYVYGKKHLEVLRSKMHIYKYEPSVYLVSLNNAMILSILNGEFEDFQVYLKELDSFAKDINSLNVFHEKRVFEIKYASLLRYYDKSNQYEKGIELTEAIEKGIQKYKSVGLSSYRIIRFYFSLALLNFYLSEWGEAHYYVGKVIELEDGKTSITTVAYCKILDLLLHLDKKNFRYLEYQIINVQRFLKKHQRLNNEEQNLLDFITKLTKEKEAAKLKIVYQKFLSEITPIKTNSFFEQLKIDKWLEGKLTDKSMIQLLHKK